MPNIGILMASTTLGLDNGIELDKNPESLTVKSKVMGYINQFLNLNKDRNFAEAAAEAVKSILSLVVMEVCTCLALCQLDLWNTVSLIYC
jgi:hypothetical protein